MIVVYNKETGDIMFTIENAMTYDRNDLSENEELIITSDESVRTTTHKVINEKVVQKTEQEINAELEARKQQQLLAMNQLKSLAMNQLKSQEKALFERLDELERRLVNLERRLK